jgi:16S rRNA (guanine(966)-N(2))-methyltransferase RsmD
LRIIAGKYRGRKLKSPTSLETRPTSDRLRETLFNILAPRIEGARFLDLCAGTGAVGIEALSRGALDVTFVDQSRKMCGLIEANVASVAVPSELYEIVVADAADYLRRQVKQQASPFDMIFFDPPYATNYAVALATIAEHATEILNDDGIVIVEHHKKKEMGERFAAMTRYREVKQGDSVLSFYCVT